MQPLAIVVQKERDAATGHCGAKRKRCSHWPLWCKKKEMQPLAIVVQKERDAATGHCGAKMRKHAH
jgi:hypothetical protein